MAGTHRESRFRSGDGARGSSWAQKTGRQCAVMASRVCFAGRVLVVTDCMCLLIWIQANNTRPSCSVFSPSNVKRGKEQIHNCSCNSPLPRTTYTRNNPGLLLANATNDPRLHSANPLTAGRVNCWALIYADTRIMFYCYSSWSRSEPAKSVMHHRSSQSPKFDSEGC